MKNITNSNKDSNTQARKDKTIKHHHMQTIQYSAPPSRR
jgi:hypothetical protein